MCVCVCVCVCVLYIPFSYLSVCMKVYQYVCLYLNIDTDLLHIFLYIPAFIKKQSGLNALQTYIVWNKNKKKLMKLL